MNSGGQVPVPGCESLVRVRDLGVRYGHLVALDGVDLDVYPGEIVVLAGENGAGKSTLVRCLAGDMAPNAGQVFVNGRKLHADPRAAARLGVAIVWQDLSLCDNLDVAANILLGQESRRVLLSDTRLHRRAAALLRELGIPGLDTAAPVGSLSSGQRQLVAVARALRDHPRFLVLDEPTAALGVAESAQVEDWVSTLPGRGTTVLIVSHDVEQMFRLADRIVVLRRGRLAATVDPAESHPDEVASILSGQPVDGSARRQLNRLHNLADQLASAEPSSSLSLILSALGAALGDEQLCIHVQDGGLLRLIGLSGLPRPLATVWQTVPSGPAGGQIGRAAATGREVISPDLQSSGLWSRYRREAKAAGAHSSWSVPFTGVGGVTGVITVVRATPGGPTRDELNLVTVYAGYAASALERDRLLGEVRARNQTLETIREVLETLAGPVPLSDGLVVALRTLKRGLAADEVGLMIRGGGGGPETTCRGCVDGDGRSTDPSTELVQAADSVLEGGGSLVLPGRANPPSSGWRMAVAFPAPEGMTALVATWATGGPEPDRQALLEDAANSLRLALEREAAERAHREAVALRSTQALQRRFLSWLSHELRTPLTAIRGYASSLLQTDVSWDGDSQERFLNRISDESARLTRLVDDLLDFSAIDAGILHLHPDWCDLVLVLEAARACLPAPGPGQVTVACPPDLPVIWADHDRLEQVFVNLLDNAVRHNPPGTRVVVQACGGAAGRVAVVVADDGQGIPKDMAAGAYGPNGDGRARKARAGLGLSIAKGIVNAHGGRLTVERLPVGTRCTVDLPVALGAPAIEVAVDG